MRKLVRAVSLCFALLGCLLLVACGVRREGIADLQTFQQNAAQYLPASAHEPLVSAEVQQALYTQYLHSFFGPWRSTAATLAVDKAFWGNSVFGTRTGYAENLQPWSLARWESLVAMQMQDTYPSMARHAITTRNASFRVMPTDKPFFYNPAKAGEGYPFDYMQNSAVWIGTPLLVTHVSADGAWYFAEAGVTYGWLPADSFGWVDAAFCCAYQKGIYATVTRDAVPLRSDSGSYVGTAHIGSLFPMVEAAELTGGGVRILVPARTVAGETELVPVSLSSATAVVVPQPLSAAAVARYANSVMGQPYGWGGLLENRDCSAAMRDIFAPFGLWLPRNSSQQGQEVGTLIPLEGMTPAQKHDSIIQRGIPFYSLIWFKGHIGLYLGQDATTGEPLLLHSVWGARTEWKGEVGRAIIGKMAITTLRFAEERDDVKPGWLYDRIKGLVLLPGHVKK